MEIHTKDVIQNIVQDTSWFRPL